MIGRTIGRYRVVSLLGVGGMATVWEARDELLGHTVALKILSEALAQSPAARRRFRHEAEIAARLEHAGIARVFASGEDQGLTYLAMEKVAGETLDERIARALLPVGEAVEVAASVAEALAYAHAHGVVHRDVTTRNVMIARDGRVLVLDFGLALAEGMSRLSSSSTVLGTPAFVAPEVLKGQDADARSDLFSLGVVLFFSLTGALPFRGDQPDVLTYAVLHQPMRRAGELRPEVPAALDHLLAKLLAREPGERHQSASELLADLRSFLGGETGPAPTPADDPGHRGAEAVTREDAAVYMAIAPIEDRSSDTTTAEARREFCRRFDQNLPALVATARRLHVVRFDRGAEVADESALRQEAGWAGASSLLLAHLNADAEVARVTFEVVDVSQGIRVAGGAALGSLLDPIALEDAVALRVRAVLGVGPVIEQAGNRAPLHDPGAGEHYVQALRHLRRSDLEPSVDGAIALLERLLAGDEPQAKYATALARACVARHALTQEHVWLTRAAEAIDRATAMRPPPHELALARGDLFVAHQQCEAALREYACALESQPPAVESWHGQSRALDALGRSLEAEEACRRAIAAEPDDWRGHQRLGVVLFHRGDYARALEPCRRVTELVPDNDMAFRNLGSTLFHMDRYEEAIRAYERSLVLHPNAHAYTSLATVFFYMGRTDEACDAFERAVALQPADPVLWGNLGEACHAQPGRERRAQEALTMAVGLMRPRLERQGATADDEGRFAGWLASLGREDEARRLVEHALARDPENVHCMVAAAIVHGQLGDREDCLRCMERAVRHGYGAGTFARSPLLRHLHGDAEFQRILRLGDAAA